MANGITNKQLVLLLVIILISGSSVFLPRLMAESAGTGGWFSLAMTAVIFGAAAAIIIKLNSMFSGKVLAEYSQDILGKFGGYLFCLIFALFFLALTIYLMVSIAHVLNNDFLLKTPTWFLIIAGLPVFGYAAYKGITNIARLCEIVAIVVLLVSLFAHGLMLVQGDFKYIRPFFVPSDLGRYFTAMKNAAIPFLGVSLLSIIPYTKSNSGKMGSVAFFSVIAACVWMIFIFESSIMMVGMNETLNYTDPTVVAFRLVEVNFIEFLTRVDILYLTGKLAGFCVYICVVYCALVEYLTRLIPKVGRGTLTIIVGVILAVLGVWATHIDNIRYLYDSYAVFAAPIAAIGVPLILMAVAKIRGLGKQGVK